MPGLLLFGLVLWAFFAAVQNDFVNYDDPDYVTNNGHVQEGLTWQNVQYAFTSTDAANWHPVTWFSHMLDCQLFGAGAWGHHLTSVLLHALNALLAFLIFKNMTGAAWRSLMLAALFALHPLRVESVAWVAERKDVLSTFFGLLAIGAYAKWSRGEKQSSVERRASRVALTPPLSRRTGEGGRRPVDGLSPLDSRPSTLDRSWYSLAMLCFALGLMCKPMLVTFPLVLLLLDYWPLNRVSGFGFRVSSSGTPGPGSSAAINSKLQTPNSKPSAVRQLLLEKIPFFLLAAGVSIVTFIVQRGSGAVVTNLSFVERIENALVSYARYLGKLLCPTHLAVFYPYPGHWPVAVIVLTILALLAMSCFAILWRRRYPYVLVGWLWFLGTLFPVIGLVQVGEQSMADRYSYIPSLGICLMAVWGAHELTRRWKYQRFTTGVVFAGAVLVCISLTRRQIGYWTDSETLFQRAIEVTHGNYLAHNSLGTAFGQQGRFNDAIAQFREALREKPGYYFARCNLGATFDRQGRLDEAVVELEEALREWPGYYTARCNLGAVFQKEGRLDDALKQFEEALKEKPDYAEARVNMGIVFGQQGRLADATRQFQEVLGDRPRYVAAHYAWGAVLDKAGRHDEAIQHYLAAVGLKANDPDAHYNLGSVLARAGRVDEAIQEFQVAIELRPDPEAYNNLGVMLEKKGLQQQAIDAYTKAIQLKPADARAHFNLGLALCRKGSLDEGITEFKEALRLKPGYADAQQGLDLALGVKKSLEPQIAPVK